VIKIIIMKTITSKVTVTSKVNCLLWIILVVFSCHSKAGTLKQVTFTPPAMLTIDAPHCTLQQPIPSAKKLILPLADCSTSSGEIEVENNLLTKIHWAQHDPQTVWIVAAFSNEYQFNLISSVNPYIICLPTCETPKDQSLTLEKASTDSKKQLLNLAEDMEMLFLFHGLSFRIPLENMLIDEFLDRSIGYTPKDVIRDGLPHFGSRRDDWKGKPRLHEGYDIYADNINVLASVAGTVVKIGKSYNAGLYVKLQHPSDLYTVYVHLNQATVQEGQSVVMGEIIGKIKGSSGNAVEPQLHFELKVEDEGIDPLPLIEDFYKNNHLIIQKISKYKELLLVKVQERDQKVQKLLKAQRR